MAEEQEVASAPQEPEVSDDELWESVGEEDASSGSDTTEPAPQETETDLVVFLIKLMLWIDHQL